MVTCPVCGVDNTDDSNYCRYCGNRLPQGDINEITLSYVPNERFEWEDDAALRTEGLSGLCALVIRAGGGREGEVIVLSGDVLTIGRSPRNDVFLDDVTVSRHHARVIRDEAGFLVEDLNSLNGTYVNRKRIERHRLTDGDEVQIGKFKLGFVEPATEGCTNS